MPGTSRRDDVTAQEIGTDTVLTDPLAGRTHVINATAAWIWSQLDGATPADEIARRLADRYAIDQEVARSDVQRITQSFDRLGLLTE